MNVRRYCSTAPGWVSFVLKRHPPEQASGGIPPPGLRLTRGAGNRFGRRDGPNHAESQPFRNMVIRALADSLHQRTNATQAKAGWSR